MTSISWTLRGGNPACNITSANYVERTTSNSEDTGATGQSLAISSKLNVFKYIDLDTSGEQYLGLSLNSPSSISYFNTGGIQVCVRFVSGSSPTAEFHVNAVRVVDAFDITDTESGEILHESDGTFKFYWEGSLKYTATMATGNTWTICANPATANAMAIYAEIDGSSPTPSTGGTLLPPPYANIGLHGL